MIMKTLSILILSTSAIFCGEAEEPKLPASVQSILNKAESAVQKNRTAYDSANEKAFSETEKSLKIELDKLTKAGKLEEALIIKKIIESFRTDLVSKVDAVSKNKEDLLGDKKINDIVGKWGTNDNVIWNFLDNGTGFHYWQGVTYTLKWEKSNGDYIVYLDGPIPVRKLIVQNKTISIIPGKFDKINS